MISALLTTYNRRDRLCRAINSVLAQTKPVDEIVVVDDGSTDGTEEMVGHRFKERVRYVKQENMGVAGARRRAVEEAKGDWIAFLDSDDEWTPDRNRAFAEFAATLPPDVGWIIGNTEVVRDGRPPATIYDVHASGLDCGPRILEDSMVVQTPFQLGLLQSSWVRRSALIQENCFSERLKHSEDFLIGVQVACSHRLAIIPDVVTRLYRTSDLKSSSADLAHRSGPDYSRARMIAFRRIIETGRKSPYTEWYGETARALCQACAQNGQSFRSILWEQFRYGVSWKAVLFTVAGMFGKRGVQFWMAATQRLRGEPTAEDASESQSDRLL